MPPLSRPTLLTWLDGMPEVENLYPLLNLLQKRGNIHVHALISRRVMGREPRLREAFTAGLKPIPATTWRMKRFTTRDMTRADAVIGLSDPAHDRSAKHKRSTRVLAANLPAIFLQHGALQMGVNVPWPDTPPMDYAAQRLLLWAPAKGEAETLTPETLSRATTTGFTKSPILPPRPITAPLRDWMARHQRRLLICQSFRWSGGRFGADDMRNFYDMLAGFLTDHPDTGVILRPHRGKVRREHAQMDADLERKHSNLIVSREKSGLLKRASILDTLALVDAMVTPESTTVLDAIYAGKPVALTDSAPRLFTDLPRITGAESLSAFAQNPDIASPACTEIRAHYGEVQTNLQTAAKAVEAALLPR